MMAKKEFTINFSLDPPSCSPGEKINHFLIDT